MTASGGFDVALARFNSDGMLDTSFGTGGKVTTAIGPGSRRDRAHDVAVLNDGKIVVAGFADMGPDAGQRNFMLARYNPDGSLDGTFGSGGIVITRIAPGDNNDVATTNGLTITDAGKFILSGQANMGAGAGGVNFALARYNPDGTLDGSFGIGGIVTTAVAPVTISTLLRAWRSTQPARSWQAESPSQEASSSTGHSSATTPTDRSTTPSGRAAR